MKVIVICQDNSTFEFSSVLIYPVWDANAEVGKQYQIRVSHGTVFFQSKQDYAIYKCGSEKIRNAFHAILNQMYLDLHAKWLTSTSGIGVIKLKEIQEAIYHE
jgi:hypothetical protein